MGVSFVTNSWNFYFSQMQRYHSKHHGTTFHANFQIDNTAHMTVTQFLLLAMCMRTMACREMELCNIIVFHYVFISFCFRRCILPFVTSKEYFAKLIDASWRFFLSAYVLFIHDLTVFICIHAICMLHLHHQRHHCLHHTACGLFSLHLKWSLSSISYEKLQVRQSIRNLG